MASTATRGYYPTKVEPVVHLAFELGDAHWKLGFTTGFGQKPRLRTIGAGDIAALEDEVALAKKRFRLKPSTRVVSCYEAGRDGRYLVPDTTKFRCVNNLDGRRRSVVSPIPRGSRPRALQMCRESGARLRTVRWSESGSSVTRTWHFRVCGATPLPKLSLAQSDPRRYERHYLWQAAASGRPPPNPGLQRQSWAVARSR